MDSKNVDLAQQRFMVSIYEIRQELVFAEEFSGRYVKTVTLSDGTPRTIELTPLMRDGTPTLELVDTGSRRNMSLIPVRTNAQTIGSLMVRVVDMEDIDAARAEWHKSLPASPVLPPETSLTTLADFPPPVSRKGWKYSTTTPRLCGLS